MGYAPSTSERPMTIVNEIPKQIPVVGQPQRQFLATLFFTILVLRDRVNLRNLSRYCDFSEHTIAQQFQAQFDSFLTVSKPFFVVPGRRVLFQALLIEYPRRCFRKVVAEVDYFFSNSSRRCSLSLFAASPRPENKLAAVRRRADQRWRP